MKSTFKKRKLKAIECMKKLDICNAFIKDLEERNTVCYFDNFIGYWAFQDPELYAKVKEIESKYKCTVYAITHEPTEFGELYDFLLIPQYEEDWNVLMQEKNYFYAYAYVWNKTDNSLSEFGDIIIESFVGGIRRIG